MAMTGLDDQVTTAENYRRFAENEAAGRSPAYETLALAVASDPDVLSFLSTLPPDKRQPNLLFAAARHLLHTAPDADALRELATAQAGRLRATMLSRRTQTNEPGRCATLLPALAALDGPLALIEVGASAGLCLHVDRYSYDYGHTHLTGGDPQAPTLRCRAQGPHPELRMPEVAWAAGIDLNPLDPSDPEDRSWLECLVWPGQTARRERLVSALGTAQRRPVPVHEGDLFEALPALVRQAPRGARVVVFHSAVLAYVTPEVRADFAELTRELGVVWIANEAPGVVADIEPPRFETSPFVLTVDGAPAAYTHPHGDWIHWM
ncbi:DUF2332 domain-containing protein [Streptomyces sp. NPDC050145]|uniref:DUF2332 domain-containing protein n=1 Tax=Streptomyces sp. NPDC050145 TaxID=3365602 RepID=UPI0037B03747